MYRAAHVVTLLIFSLLASADSVTQTDWSSGSGILGPVTDWESYYYQSSDINWFESPGIIKLSIEDAKQSLDNNFEGANSVFPSDIDNDGDLDVLGAAYISHAIAWWENSGSTTGAWLKHEVDNEFYGAHSVYAGDMDGDGDQDIVGAARFSDEIAWWENSDTSPGIVWTKHSVSMQFDGAISVCVIDLNGDEALDILAAAYDGDDLTWWENQGSGENWTEHVIDGDFNGSCSCSSGDIDADGDNDVAGASWFGNEIAWWENLDGSGLNWAKHTVRSGFNSASCVQIEDVNEDDYLDVLGSSWMDYDVVWWENTSGTGLDWVEHLVDGGFKYATHVCSEDMDTDGDVDVLGTSGLSLSRIAWWENLDGMGTSWDEHTIELFSGASCVYAVDIGGTSRVDVLGTGAGADEIAIWYLDVFCDGSLESCILDMQGDPGWDSIDWTADEPSETSVAFQVRSCDIDVPDSMLAKAWSDTLFAPGSLVGLLPEGDSYFQYRAILQTTDQESSPNLQDFTITWTNVGTQEQPALPVPEPLLLFIEPNPCSGSPSVLFQVQEPGTVNMTIFDIAGRIIQNYGNEYIQGLHSFKPADLAPGIYACRMSTGDVTATQRFVVIE